MRTRKFRLLALLLACLMILQTSDTLVVEAAERLDKEIHPAEHIELIVPQALQDGSSYFFIREDNFLISEKSTEKLYIPIQRAGNLDTEAEVTLKLVDVTSRHDVNYTAEIYREEIEPEIAIGDVSVLDLTLNATEQEEFEPLNRESLGEAVYAQGGAEVLDANGNSIGEFTAQPVDENGDPIEAPEAPAEDADNVEVKKTPTATAPGETALTLQPDESAEAGDWSEAPQSQTDALRQARDSFTGTVSDRQQMNSSDDLLDRLNAQQEEAELVQDSYPGREYRLHFAAGEEAKYLVITPLYSEAADGDCDLMLMLKEPDADQTIPEDYMLSAVVIADEDEQQPLVLRMAAETIQAEDGMVYITVEREGRINSIAGVHVFSWGGNAEMGEDYGGVGADLFFPMGITSRTIELPVLYNEEQRDFYVSLSTLEGSDVELDEQKTTHVIIPAATQETIAAGLMRDAGDKNIMLGEQINLKKSRGYKIGTYFEWLEDGYGFKAETPDDKEDDWAGWHWVLNPGYFYDGFYIQYDYMLNWCDGQINFDTFSDEKGQRTSSHKDSDGGNHTGRSLYWYYAETKTPYAARANIKNYNNDGWPWTEDWARLTVKSVEPIIRRFRIQVVSPVMEDGTAPYFYGVDAQTTKEYVAVQLNDRSDDSCYIWGGENISVNQLASQRYVQLVALEAVKDDGSTYRIAVNDGTSQSVVATLDESLVNKLGEQGFFKWEKGPGGPNTDPNSKQGYLKIRPVFAYVLAQAEVKANQHGSLWTDTPTSPSVLWQFNSDGLFNGRLGANSRHNVNWKAEKDAQGNEYFVFTATADDPYVSVDIPCKDAKELVWAKIRVKNLSGADAIEFFAHCNGKSLSGAECVHVDLEKDTEWHTYLINVPEENIRTANTYKGYNLSQTVWTGKVDWIRLDPGWLENGTNKDGDQIAIDYVAFFPTKEAAEAFQGEKNAEGGTPLPAGEYRFHMGDLLQLHTTISEIGAQAGLRGDGFRFDLFTEKNGELLDGAASVFYINGLGALKLRGMNQKEDRTGNFYRFEPTFTHERNQVVVQIEDEDLAWFDTESGVFTTENKWLDENGTTWNYVIATEIRSNEIFELRAEPKDATHVPLWTSTQSTDTYSGNSFYLMSGVYPTDNIVKLTVDRTATKHAYYALSGAVYSQVMNLATARASDVMYPAQEALLSSGMTSCLSQETGEFAMPPLYLVGNTMSRYTVTYNGTVSIREVRLSPATAPKKDTAYFNPADGSSGTVKAIPVSLNVVSVPSYSLNSAHFEKVALDQDGVLEGVLNTVEMNGQKVVFTVKVDPGLPYVYHNEHFTENITDVTLFFQNQTTKEVHGTYSIHDKPNPLIKGEIEWDPDTLTATLTFRNFAPDTPGEYSAGDVLMLQLTTDKKVGLSAWVNQDMSYEPVASGIAVVTDLDYEPQALEYEVPSVANLLQILGPDEDGTSQGSGNSFGRLPFLGEVTTGLKILTLLVNRGLNSNGAAKKILTDLKTEANENYAMEDDNIEIDDDEGGYTPEDDGISGQEGEGVAPPSSWSISVAFTTERTYYGGQRFLIAIVASKQLAGSLNQNRTNPYKDAAQAWEYFTNGRYQQPNAGDMIYNPLFSSKGEEIQSHFGGGHFTISLYFGAYIDFGYIVQNGQKSGSLVLMGAGGFFGGSATLGYVFYTTIFGFPAYANPEASIDLTFFLGGTADPDVTLEKFQTGDTVSGDQVHFSFEFKGKLNAGLTLGLGIYKVLGVRASAIFGFEAGYGLHMAEWFPAVDSNWGYTTDITFKGTIDFVIGSLDLVDYSWPLPWNGGWMGCLQEVRRASILIKFVKGGIADGRGSEAARARAQEMLDELVAYSGDRDHIETEMLKSLTTALRKYAYQEDIITWTQNNRVQMNRQGGVIGGMIEDDQQGDFGISNPSRGVQSASTNTLFRTRNHVSANWIGGEKTRGTFQPVHSETLQEDAFTQTASQIIALGGNRFLMVFLSDDAAKDRQQAATLMWTVYDANSDEWTEPVAVQNDSTADSKPSLTDAGDKIILSFASIPEAKYQARKQTVTDRLTELNGGTAPDEEEVLVELEADPVGVMSLMEIYTAEFDKTTKQFGAIEQLTDDDYYDDNPQAVYDEETGDYIVLYYKTAQDTEEYADQTEALIDLTGVAADPNKTYSMLCYMLYNNQTEAPDAQGNTHAAGWARDYFFANETSQDAAGQAQTLERWKGQRFLPTAIQGMSDPPIGDLTVCAGYNGIAVYAFTVDKDYNLSTGEDKELYVQFYRFAEHRTYVPVKIAGEAVQNGRTVAVDVGSPQLVRNDGSTWLFWREDEESLKYLNISELLNAKVAAKADPGEDDWTWAVKEDGSFAVDAVTGETYSPKTQTVDFGSVMTSEDFTATEYRVITDKDDNLFVVWTDTLLYDFDDELTGETYQRSAHEIYATAMVKEDLEISGTETDIETEESTPTTGSAQTANWSKPYRLTRDNQFNDGIALALDDNGGLIIVHNQYDQLRAASDKDVERLLDEGVLTTRDVDGSTYLLGSLWYNSPIRLTVTRCDAVGSLEATAFSYSHSHPVAGELIQVWAAIENVGLTSADGCTIDFYECRDGVRGRKVAHYESAEQLQVNTARMVTFLWQIPEAGPEGLSLEAVISEQKPDSSYYPATISRSDPFEILPMFDLTLESFEQNDDSFDAKFSVTNSGNTDYPEGTKVRLSLVGLYGDLAELYGVEDSTLIEKDVSGLAPRETLEFEESIELPISLFAYCGYDAVQAFIMDENGVALAQTAQRLICMDAPLHPELNHGNPIELNVGQEWTTELSFETNPFLSADEIVYAVEDPDIASVDADGTVTGLARGETVLTATMLPSGRTVEIPVKVAGFLFDDVQDESRFYYEPVYWAVENGITQGTTDTTFSPNATCTRGQVVTFLYRAAGSPKPAAESCAFTDVKTDAYYYDAVLWAVENGITQGTSATRFSPGSSCTRGQVVTFLHRAAGTPKPTAESCAFTDVKAGAYYYDAMLWAVENGITQGTSETKFSPNDKCTRGQVVTFLYRAEKQG